MKRIALSIIILFALVPSNAYNVQLIQFYNYLLSDYVKNTGKLKFEKYQIIKYENKWLTKSSANGKPIIPVIDLKTNYLSVRDDLLSSNTWDHKIEIQLFPSAKNEQIIGFSVSDSQNSREYFYSFYSIKTGTYTKITKLCLGEFTYKEFMKDGYAETKIVTEMISRLINLEFSKGGDEIVLVLQTYPVEWTRECGASDEVSKNLDDFLKHIKYRKIYFKWNPSKGAFEIKSKELIQTTFT